MTFCPFRSIEFCLGQCRCGNKDVTVWLVVRAKFCSNKDYRLKKKITSGLANIKYQITYGADLMKIFSFLKLDKFSCIFCFGLTV